MTIDLTSKPYSVEVVRSRSRRATITLRYAGERIFRLSVPAETPEAFIAEFLASKQGWMQKTIEKISLRESRGVILPGSSVTTDFHVLVAEADEQLVYPQYRVENLRNERKSVFRLAPEFFEPGRQEKLRQNLEKYLLARIVREGASSLIERTQYWARHHELPVTEVFVRVQKSRLGYCTFDNRIMLNGRLLFAPLRIRDYVIHHELAHTRHKNHSKQFWSFLEKIFPGAKAADKLLRDPAVYAMKVDE